MSGSANQKQFITMSDSANRFTSSKLPANNDKNIDH